MTSAHASVRWRADGAGRRCRRGAGIAALLLWLALPGVAAAAAAPAVTRTDAELLRALQQCAARLDPERDIGVEPILRSCADLEAQWSRPEAARWLPAGWRDAGGDLSAASLRELAALIRDAEATPAAGVSLDAAALPAALADVAREADDEPGLFKRLLRWIRSLVERDREVDDTDDPLDWIDPSWRSERIWTVVGWLAFGVVLLLAGWVIRNELRAAGWRGLHRAARVPATAAGLPTTAATVDVAALPLRERPGRLLRSVAAELEARGALARSAAATSRQILRAALQADAGQQAQLRELSRAADAVRYAPEPPDAATLERASAAGAALLATLREPDAVAQGRP